MNWFKRVAIYGLVFLGGVTSSNSTEGLEKKVFPDEFSDESKLVFENDVSAWKNAEGKSIAVNLEDHARIFCDELSEQYGRDEKLFRKIPERLVFSNQIFEMYNPMINKSYLHNETDSEVAEDYAKYLVKKAVKGSRDEVEWIDDAENSFRSLFDFRFSLFGEKANGKEATPTLDEEDRLYNLRLDETTSVEKVAPFFGENYRFDIKGGYGFEGFDLNGCVGGVYGEMRLKDFQILGHHFHSAKCRVEADQEAKFEMTKIFCEGVYSRLSVKSDKFPINVKSSNLSLIWEKKDKSRFSAGLGYNPDQGSFSGNLRYVKRFGKIH